MELDLLLFFERLFRRRKKEKMMIPLKKTMWCLLLMMPCWMATTASASVSASSSASSLETTNKSYKLSRPIGRRQTKFLQPSTFSNEATGTGTATVSNTPPDCSDPVKTDNRLECWLWQLPIEIPKQSFEQDWITVDISNMVCSNFVLKNVQSSYSHGKKSTLSSSPPALTTSIGELAATCQGNYHASGGFSGSVKASVIQQDDTDALEVTVHVLSSSSSSSFQNEVEDEDLEGTTTSSVKFTLNSNLSPTSWETEQCQTHLKASGLHFSGSMSAKLIQAFAKTIGHYITDALQEYVCPLLKDQLDPLITDYLHQFNDWTKKYIPSSSSSSFIETTLEEMGPQRTEAVTHHQKHRAVAITDTDGNDDGNANATNPAKWTTVHWLLDIFNEQLDAHLQRGWLLDPYSFPGISHDCRNMFRGISGWIVSLLGETIKIPLPKVFANLVIDLPFIDGAKVTLHLDHVAIKGIDQLDTIQLFVPNDTTGELDSTVFTDDGFNVTSPISFEIEIPKRDGSGEMHTLRESFYVSLDVSSVEMMVPTLLHVINWDTTSLLQVVQAVQDFVDTHDMKHLSCLFATIDQVVLTDWIATVIFESLFISRELKSHSLEDDLDQLINRMLDLATTEYPNLWTSLAKGLVQGPGREALNHFISAWFASHSNKAAADNDDNVNGICPPVDTNSSHKWMNFTKLKFLNQLNRYLNHSHTMATMNHYLLCLGSIAEELVEEEYDHYDYDVIEHEDDFDETDIENDVAPLSSSSFFLSYESPLDDLLASGVEELQTIVQDTGITISTIETKYMDSLSILQAIEPIEATTLESKLRWGDDDSHPPQATIVLNVPQIDGILNVTVFTNLHILMAAKIDYNLHALENITIAHLLDHWQCVMFPAAEIRLLPDSMDVSTPIIGVNVTATVSDGRHVTVSTYDYENIPQAWHHGTEWALEWVRQIINKALEEWVTLSPNTCPGIVSPPPPKPTPGDSDDEHPHHHHHHHHKSGNGNASFMWIESPFTWFLIVLFVLAQSGLLMAIKAGNQPLQSEVLENNSGNHDGDGDDERRQPLLQDAMNNEEEIFYDPVPMEDDVNQLPLEESGFDIDLTQQGQEQGQGQEQQEQGQQEQQEADEVRRMHILEQDKDVPRQRRTGAKSLFLARQIPEVLRYIVPAFLVATIVLLISSNLSVGASVDMSVHVGDHDTLQLPGLFEFSLGNTIVEFYQAGIYPLLALVVGFSFLWPYLKLLWMFKTWITPYDDTHQRERHLLRLDAWSKYSLVDTYVLILFLVAFRFHMDLSESLSLDVYIATEYGFYSFLLATCLSLVLGHGMLFLHRKADGHDSHDDDEIIESVFDHGFQLHPRRRTKRRLSRLFQLILFTCCLSSFAFLIIGYNEKSFTFEFGGIAGMLLSDEQRKTSYSVLSLGSAIRTSAKDPSSIGIFCLQMAYYFYAIVTPMVCLIIMTIVLVYPLSLNKQRRLLIIAEIANAWSGTEVFLLSIVAALFEISTFAEFMIGTKCDLINDIAKQFINNATMMTTTVMGDDGGGTNENINTDAMVCFNVEASVESNCWYLIVGVILHWIVISIGLKFCHEAIIERLDRSSLTSSGSSGSATSTSNVFGMFGNTATSNGNNNNNIVNKIMSRIVFGHPIPGTIDDNDDELFLLDHEHSINNNDNNITNGINYDQFNDEENYNNAKDNEEENDDDDEEERFQPAWKHWF